MDPGADTKSPVCQVGPESELHPITHPLHRCSGLSKAAAKSKANKISPSAEPVESRTSLKT